jgi:site-specific DNA-methyltransferase (adenine-specific)
VIELNKIYYGNCLDVMKTLPNDSIDCLITSPPYNVGKEYEINVSEEIYQNFLDSVAVEIKRIMKVDGRICWNVPYQMQLAGSKEIFSQWYCSYQSFKKAGLRFRDNITWNQNNSDNDTAWGSWKSASAPWLRHQTESIMIFYKEVWKKINKGEDTISKDKFLKCIVDLWNMPTAKKDYHPCPYPMELPLRCIELFSFKNDIILDPFAGQMTTASACIKTGRNFICIEKEKKYYELGSKRIDQELAQFKMAM